MLYFFFAVSSLFRPCACCMRFPTERERTPLVPGWPLLSQICPKYQTTSIISRFSGYRLFFRLHSPCGHVLPRPLCPTPLFSFYWAMVPPFSFDAPCVPPDSHVVPQPDKACPPNVLPRVLFIAPHVLVELEESTLPVFFPFTRNKIGSSKTFPSRFPCLLSEFPFYRAGSNNQSDLPFFLPAVSPFLPPLRRNFRPFPSLREKGLVPRAVFLTL